MEDLALRFGDEAARMRYRHMSAVAQWSFNQLFWNEKLGCLCDAINGGPPDPSIRPSDLRSEPASQNVAPGGGKVAGFSLRDSKSAYYWATPDQLCPCGENPDHSCKKQGSEVDLALTTSPREKTLEPGTMRSCLSASYSLPEPFCTLTKGIAERKTGL
jgi:hypothetical protein